MANVLRLPLNTSDGHRLANKFYKQDSNPYGLLITLPGNHYGVDGPLLYYPRELLWESGWDTLALTYGYQTAGIEFGHEAVPGVLQECQGAVQFILAERNYPHIGLMGKSLGCFVITQLCDILDSLSNARCVHLTPPIGTPFFDQSFIQTDQLSHLAIGTQDRFYSPQALEELQRARDFGLTLIENADHSMNVVGNLDASLEAVQVVVQDVIEFLLGNSDRGSVNK